MKIKVLVVDDHDLVRQGIKAVLATEDTMEVVGEATDGRQAIEQSAALNPDVILMDLRMPGTDGITAARSIRAAQPDVKIVALSAFDEDREVFSSIEAGICGYVLKDIRPSQLSKTIQTVFEGKSQLDPTIAHKLINSLANKGHPDPAAHVGLTRRETEVLQLLAKGLKNRDIGERLWISEKTVKVYISRLFKKLNCHSRMEVVLKGAGLKLVDLNSEGK